MQPSGLSPYKTKGTRRKFGFKMPKMEGGFKKWLTIILGAIVGLFFIGYLCLGELRFFANHLFALGFFKKDYLIVLQNNYELRPTGGFLTGYGEASMTMGFPSGIAFSNSYAIDTENYVTPPYPHEEMLKNEWYEGYTFRDANWEPHFPDSAATLIDFYQKKFPKKEVDGMIVINLSMIENLVDELGGIELNGQKLTKDNLFKELTDSVNDVDRHNEEALMERKSVLGEIAGPLLSKAKWHPFKTKRVIEEGLANKDMFLWFKKNRLEKKAEKRGWTNTMTRPENTDFLGVNIANLGAKKADRYLIKEVYHYVNIKNELPEITTEVTLRYPGEKNIYADDYRGYLRLYLPAEAEVTSDLLGARMEKEGDFKVVGAQIILPAGSRTTLSFTYQLPRTFLTNDEYRLKILKQSGDEKFYAVTVEAGNDIEIESEDFQPLENRAMWQGKLVGDLELSLKTLPDTSSPYPIEQVFTKLNEITIYWNEPVSGGSSANYQVVDMDRINASLTDIITVSNAQSEGGVTRLELEGVTEQSLERYQVLIKDVTDDVGNPIQPDPKNITVVQRIVGGEEVTPEINPSPSNLNFN